jgi:Holliday junction resolvase RusA-like endonuclease
MKAFIISIPGEPKGKGRPRYTKSGHAYTPRDTAVYEQLVRLTFKGKYPQAMPFEKDTPLKAVICAWFSIPKSVSKTKRELMEKGYIKPTKKSDADNIAKIVLDSLNKIAYYDDAQVVELTVKKGYAHYDEPCVDVMISEVSE